MVTSPILRQVVFEQHVVLDIQTSEVGTENVDHVVHALLDTEVLLLVYIFLVER